jgi:hypothetical protein
MRKQTNVRQISVSQLQLTLSRSLNSSNRKKTPLVITKAGENTHLILPRTLLDTELSSSLIEKLLQAVSVEK